MAELIVRAAAPAAKPSIAGLARLLVEYERTLRADRPERILLADDSDDALAAALVATKLLIAIEATPQAGGAATTNGRLIAQLAGA